MKFEMNVSFTPLWSMYSQSLHATLVIMTYERTNKQNLYFLIIVFFFFLLGIYGIHAQLITLTGSTTQNKKK